MSNRPILLEEHQRHLIQAKLDRVQSQDIHGILEVDDLLRLPEYAAEQIEKRTLLPASEQAGALAYYHMALEMSLSYVYYPDYTVIGIVRRRKRWALGRVFRVTGNLEQEERLQIILSPGQANEARRRFDEQFMETKS